MFYISSDRKFNSGFDSLDAGAQEVLLAPLPPSVHSFCDTDFHMLHTGKQGLPRDGKMAPKERSSAVFLHRSG